MGIIVVEIVIGMKFSAKPSGQVQIILPRSRWPACAATRSAHFVSPQLPLCHMKCGRRRDDTLLRGMSRSALAITLR